MNKKWIYAYFLTENIQNCPKIHQKCPKKAKKERFAAVYIYDYAMNIHIVYAKILRENNIKWTKKKP